MVGVVALDEEIDGSVDIAHVEAAGGLQESEFGRIFFILVTPL